MSLPHSAVEAELHATSKASAMLRSDIRRRRLGLRFPLVPLEFFDSVHQRLINIVVRRGRCARFRFFQNFPSTSTACADHIAEFAFAVRMFVYFPRYQLLFRVAIT